MILGMLKDVCRSGGGGVCGEARKEAIQLYHSYLDNVTRQNWWDTKIGDCEQGSRILEAVPEVRRDIVLLAVADKEVEKQDYYKKFARQRLITHLLRQKLPYEEPHLCEVLSWCHRDCYGGAMGYALAAVERHVAGHGMSDVMRKQLEGVKKLMAASRESGAGIRKVRRRVLDLLGEDPQEHIVVDEKEPWASKMLADLAQLPKSTEMALRKLIVHAGTASGGQPSKKWLQQASDYLQSLDDELLIAVLTDWFVAFDSPREEAVKNWRGSRWSVAEVNDDLLKGLIWIASLFADDELIRAITKAGQSGQRKIPGCGPRSSKVSNAAVWALGKIDRPLAMGQLAIMRARIKNKLVQKQIDKAMQTVAARLNVPADELEEMAVPAYGLTEVGKRVEVLGAHTAELVVSGTAATELRWVKEGGKPQKTVPKAVKTDFAEELKELRSSAKDIQKILPAQRDRIDGLFLEKKVWRYSTWAERYLNHFLVGTLARRLIWVLKRGPEDNVAGIWHEGHLVDVTGEPIGFDPEHTQVSLWHPIDWKTEEVVAWREFLFSHQIVQPFKQAHREIYLLTDAERKTEVYSNRFAAHLIKQHQFNALCGARRWKNTLRLMVDDMYPPASRVLRQWGLRAEFWIEGVGEDFGVDTNDAGTFLYLATDQVRFYPIAATQAMGHACGGGYEWFGRQDEPQPIALDQVPPLVLTEILRDVDLFVGVASVGNDPHWVDGGREVPHQNYWANYSFGELSQTAQTRKEILSRLVPRLKIADRCTFDDRFLIVKGTLKTYKIHLGSGNILMAPNDQYLCIVPKASAMNAAAGKVFLPFEGDRVMAIVLSKAFLLADDQKITDTTIVSQIKS